MTNPMIQGLPCPECGDMNTPVRHSGHDVEGNRVRRRDCANCDERFTTVEVPIDASFFRLVQPTRETKAFPHEEGADFIEIETCRTSGRPEVSVRKARATLRTCRRGLHRIVGDNMITWNSKRGQCRTCYNDARRESYHAKRAMGWRRLASGAWSRVA